MSEIRVITEPQILVVGRPSLDETGLAGFLARIDAQGWKSDAPSAAEALCEVAGRVCYESFKKPRPGGNKSYLDHILECGHGRVLEHATWTLLIAGVSRSLAQELYTHTVGLSKSMLSQRFVDESDCAFILPPALVGCEETEAGTVWLDACNWSANRYRLLSKMMEGKAEFVELPSTLRRKRAREAARSVLPNCVETKICLTGNARSFRHLIETRGTAEADAEIRRLAFALLGVLKAEAPNLFSDYETGRVAGVEVIQTPFMKV